VKIQRHKKFVVKTLDEVAIRRAGGFRIIHMKRGVGVLIPRGSRLQALKRAEDARDSHSDK